MVYNQNFVPGWNAIYMNLLNKVSKTIITFNDYTSPFSQMLQAMETGDYVEDIHINPGTVLLQDTVTNSDVLTDYYDDLAVAVYKTNADLQFPSTYREYVVRTGFTLVQNVSELITTLTANIRTTVEFWRQKLVKQMLYNAYHYGMISAKTISDPRLGKDQGGQFAVALNVAIDDFRTEINPRNVIYNNRVGITEAQKRQTITNDFPYVIIFNEFIRDAEFLNALNLALIEKFRSGNSNSDWMNRIINLNLEDFPSSIPPIDRDDVTGTNVRADNINFFPKPRDKDGNLEFGDAPLGGDTICAFVLDPKVLKLFTQLDIQTAWLNPATLSHTNREIYRGIVDLGAFNKILAITCNAGQEVTPTP